MIGVLPLTDKQRAVMSVLWVHGPTTEEGIRDYLNLDSVRGAGNTIGSLRRRGYIRRARDGVSWEAA